MDKETAIKLLGGTPTLAAAAIGITAQAVSDWPDVLPPRISDRVQAALYRQQMAQVGAAQPADRSDKAAAAGVRRKDVVRTKDCRFAEGKGRGGRRG